MFELKHCAICVKYGSESLAKTSIFSHFDSNALPCVLSVIIIPILVSNLVPLSRFGLAVRR